MENNSNRYKSWRLLMLDLANVDCKKRKDEEKDDGIYDKSHP